MVSTDVILGSRRTNSVKAYLLSPCCLVCSIVLKVLGLAEYDSILYARLQFIYLSILYIITVDFIGSFLKSLR